MKREDASKIHVIDSNVFIEGSYLELPFKNMVTVPEVSSEMRAFKAQVRFDISKIKIMDPKPEFIRKVVEKADEIGDIELANTDIKAVALALQVKGILVTDDYSMQNLAAHLKIPFMGFLREGISKKRRWNR